MSLESRLEQLVAGGNFDEAINACRDEMLYNHVTPEQRIELIFAIALCQHFQLQACMAAITANGKQLAQVLGITEEEKAKVTIHLANHFQQLATRVQDNGKAE